MTALSGASPAVRSDALVGRWRLVGWRTVTEDGAVAHTPLGERPSLTRP